MERYLVNLSLGDWNLNRGRHETLFRLTILLRNILRFWTTVSRAGHLGSVELIMRILTRTVIFIARSTEQIVWVGHVWYFSATEVLESLPQHGIHCLRFLLFILIASSQRFDSRSVKFTTLTRTSFAEQEDWLLSLFDAI